MTSPYKAARQYEQMGFSVIPIREGEKRPLVKWERYASQKPTETELMAMFSGSSNNIGIVTGPVSGIVAIDIDDPSLYEGFIQQYPTGMVARTPSGGYHLVYRYSGDDIGNSVSKLTSGIDVRGSHGYIVAAPSRVRLSEGGVGVYSWVSSKEPAMLPDKLHDIIIEEVQPVKTVERAGDDGHNLLAEIIVNGFTPHQHNVQARDLARYMARMGTHEDAIYNMLDALNRADDTPLPASELKATVTSSINYERKRLSNKKTDKPKKGFVAHGLVDVITQYEDKSQDWLIEGWLPSRSVGVVTAPPENYKTWLALEAAVAVALGDGAVFLNGFDTKEPSTVLIIQQEDYIAKTAERLRTIMWSLSADLRYDFYQQKEDDGSYTFSFGSAWNAPIMLHTDSMLSFDDEASIEGLEALIRDNNVKLVVIDPLYSLGAADDYFAALARKMIIIKQLRDTYGVTFLFVHHNKKGTKNGKIVDAKEREGMWGSQLLNGSFEFFWMINMAEGQRIITRTGKAFDGRQETFAIEFNINTALAHVNDSGDVDGDKPYYLTKLSMPTSDQMNDNETTILNLINLMGTATHKQIVDETGLPKPTVTRSIKNLLALGSIEPSQDTKNSRSKAYVGVQEY